MKKMILAEALLNPGTANVSRGDLASVYKHASAFWKAHPHADIHIMVLDIATNRIEKTLAVWKGKKRIDAKLFNNTVAVVRTPVVPTMSEVEKYGAGDANPDTLCANWRKGCNGVTDGSIGDRLTYCDDCQNLLGK